MALDPEDPDRPPLALDASDVGCDLAQVDDLLRACLRARQEGFEPRLEHVSSDLAGLLQLMGLDEMLPDRG